MIRRSVSLAVRTVGGAVVGGVLAAIADMTVGQQIAGTVLEAGHPNAPLVWTAIGFVVVVAALKEVGEA